MVVESSLDSAVEEAQKSRAETLFCLASSSVSYLASATKINSGGSSALYLWRKKISKVLVAPKLGWRLNYNKYVYYHSPTGLPPPYALNIHHRPYVTFSSVLVPPLPVGAPNDTKTKAHL